MTAVAFVVSGRPVLSALLLSELALGLVIVGLALVGYRRSSSRPMLYLASGVAFLTLVPPIGSFLAGNLVSVRAVPLADSGITVVGLLLVLYSIVVARREQPGRH